MLVFSASPLYAEEPVPQPAREEAPEWDPAYRRFGEADVVFAGVLAFSVGGAMLTLRPDEAGQRGGVLFDDRARTWLRSDTEAGRLRAQDISTMTQNVLVAFPYLVESLGLGLGYHRNSEAAFQMAAINTQAFLVTAGATLLTKSLVSRERPYVAGCSGGSCGGAGKNKSFISGHAAASFTGAGLICAHHEALALFENAWADGAICGIAVAAAASTSLLRIASDEHYMTDVLAGAAVGILSGYFLPKLIYYAGFEGDD